MLKYNKLIKRINKHKFLWLLIVLLIITGLSEGLYYLKITKKEQQLPVLLNNPSASITYPSSEPVTGNKVLPPIIAIVAITSNSPRIGQIIPFSITFTTLKQEYKAIGEIKSSGIVSIKNKPNLIWLNLSANLPQQETGTIKLTGEGKGNLSFTIKIYDNSGKFLYSKSSYLYFYAATDEVLTGYTSSDTLEIEKLKSDYEIGIISKDTYQKGIERLLYGGAKENIQTTYPSPSLK